MVAIPNLVGDSITKLHQQRCQGKLAYDEFEEMNDLMEIVNSKMVEIESNLRK